MFFDYRSKKGCKSNVHDICNRRVVIVIEIPLLIYYSIIVGGEIKYHKTRFLLNFSFFTFRQKRKEKIEMDIVHANRRMPCVIPFPYSHIYTDNVDL